jgi:hypothetical protein
MKSWMCYAGWIGETTHDINKNKDRNKFNFITDMRNENVLTLACT